MLNYKPSFTELPILLKEAIDMIGRNVETDNPPYNCRPIILYKRHHLWLTD